MIYMQTSELYHHGIKGQKWGIRRYQNEDGTLTEEGKRQFEEKARAAHLELKSYMSGDKKSEKFYKDLQKKISDDEKKHGVTSFNKFERIGENKIKYSTVYINNKDYKKFLKENEKSIENGSNYLLSLGLFSNSHILDID